MNILKPLIVATIILTAILCIEYPFFAALSIAVVGAVGAGILILLIKFIVWIDQTYF